MKYLFFSLIIVIVSTSCRQESKEDVIKYEGEIIPYDSVSYVKASPENDALAFSKVSGPQWLSVSQTGILSGTPDKSNGGTNSFIVQASDGKGNRSNVPLLIEVIVPPNLAPEWSGDTLYFADATAGTQYDEAIATGTDISDPENDDLTFMKISGSSWLTITPNGLLSGTPGNSDEGTNNFEVEATDGNGNTVNVVLHIEVISINDIQLFDNSKIEVYPVPTTDVLKVTGVVGSFNYRIYHMSGYKVMEGESENATIYIEGLVSGYYILRIEEVALKIIKN